jgi:hypothetical protein
MDGKIKILGISLAIMTFSFGNVAIAYSPDLFTPITESITESKDTDTSTVAPVVPPSSTIDGVDVPYEVLEYAQLEYQGHAIDKVTKINRGGQEMYRLRVAPSSAAQDYECIFLLYGIDWKLIADEKVAPPVIPRPVQRIPKPEPTNLPNPQPEPTTTPPQPTTTAPPASQNVPQGSPTAAPPAPSPTPTTPPSGNVAPPPTPPSNDTTPNNNEPSND